LLLPAQGQWDVASTGMASGRAPFGFPVTN
jgi:hypothetical protein